MKSAIHHPNPIEIQLHQKSRMLDIAFDDGKHFHLPCKYLRVFSPSAEVKVAEQRGQLVTARDDVNISQINPIGHYAIQLFFDDGHTTGIYSWQTLYELGMYQEKNWQAYLAKLAGVRAGESADKKRHIRLLYFVNLPAEVGRESEEVELPGDVADVQSLINWLKKRGPAWDKAFSVPALKITVNKVFVEPGSPLQDGDEVAVVPGTGQ